MTGHHFYFFVWGLFAHSLHLKSFFDFLGVNFFLQNRFSENIILQRSLHTDLQYNKNEAEINTFLALLFHDRWHHTLIYSLVILDHHIGHLVDLLNIHFWKQMCRQGLRLLE